MPCAACGVVDLVGQALQQRADLVVIPVDRLDEGFFALSTKIAGEVLQKFVNYRVRVAIVGDLAQYLSASAALRAFVHEANQGRQICFTTDLAELDARLERWMTVG